MSINIVTISGNLTRDPELRQATNTSVLSFGVAVNDRRRNPQSGQWENVPNFVDCIVFGSRADALAGLLHKGSKVAIDGKLRYSSWEGKDGKKRSKLEVVVNELELMQRETSQQPQHPQRPQQGYQRPQQGYQQPQQGYQRPQQGYQRPQQGYQQPDPVPFD
jgi:single-strand DNA-binding protein